MNNWARRERNHLINSLLFASLHIHKGHRGHLFLLFLLFFVLVSEWLGVCGFLPFPISFFFYSAALFIVMSYTIHSRHQFSSVTGHASPFPCMTDCTLLESAHYFVSSYTSCVSYIVPSFFSFSFL
ncbi:hypothetical protein ASPWEDRAFT_314947 [Aspergillus wentii DTO 134E9]|uniref:Uncharacterized protein n=1 Tax=Aspergillus wentii DTO 134E9 TaxID=1073089 RepID=A0A1L9RTF4_ASPWE|nr:uncharacterized protein ASPWEDRAFT_314947 [Aspergillus wentii DTO 134E9]OJJ38212.1 hypothetical protein ASPWEDRAFT_314947 [Aspergillus wentii DTO 134E9]